MAKELQSVDISHLPELLRFAEEVRKSKQPRVLRRNDEQLAMIIPLEAVPPKRRRTGILSRDDSLFRLIGIGRSGIPGGISWRKHEYFLRAFRDDNETR